MAPIDNYSGAVCILIAILTLSPCDGSHFGGGVISWRPSTSSSTIILESRLSWKISEYNCSHGDPGVSNKSDSVACPVGCPASSYDLTFRCTDYSIYGQWTTLRSSQEVTVTDSQVIIVFASDSWIYFSGWSLISRADLTVRSDTGSINTPPITDMIPIIRLTESHPRTIRIPVWDVDGDIVKCRMAINPSIDGYDECNAVCSKFPEASLDEDSCTLTYSGLSFSTGYRAVAIQIEDFSASDPNTPLSSVPLQFLVYVSSTTEAEINLPVFVSPTPADGSIVVYEYDNTMAMNVTAMAPRWVSAIETITPVALVASTAQTWSNSTGYYITVSLTWTPHLAYISSAKAHIVCMAAVNELGSVVRCIHLLEKSIAATTTTITPTSTTTYKATPLTITTPTATTTTTPAATTTTTPITATTTTTITTPLTQTTTTTTSAPTTSTTTPAPTTTTTTHVPTTSTTTPAPTTTTTTPAPTTSKTTPAPTTTTTTHVPTTSTTTHAPTTSTTTLAPTPSTTTPATTTTTTPPATTKTTTSPAVTSSTTPTTTTTKISTTTTAHTETTTTTPTTTTTKTSTTTTVPTETTTTTPTTTTTTSDATTTTAALPTTTITTPTETTSVTTTITTKSALITTTTSTTTITSVATTTTTPTATTNTAATMTTTHTTTTTAAATMTISPTTTTSTATTTITTPTETTTTTPAETTTTTHAETTTTTPASLTTTTYAPTTTSSPADTTVKTHAATTTTTPEATTTTTPANMTISTLATTSVITHAVSTTTTPAVTNTTSTQSPTSTSTINTNSSLATTAETTTNKSVDLFEYEVDFDGQFQAINADTRSVTFSAGIPVFETLHTKVYLSSNGVISLTSEYKNPTPFNNIRDYSTRTLLAPYFANIDGGNVFYKVYNFETKVGSLNNDDVLTIETLVEKYGQANGYKAKFVLLVTWKHVKPYQAGQNKASDQEATFQLVLTTDGVDTFVMYIYGYDQMKWISERPYQVWIGYTSEGIYNKTHVLSFTPYTSRMDKFALTEGVRGFLFYRLTAAGAQKTNYAVLCLDWFHKNNGQDLIVAGAHIPDCPCDLNRLALDVWFKPFPDSTRAHGTTCAIVKPSATFSPYGKICCYNTTTQLWINERPYAGTFINFHPDSHPDKYLDSDFNPRRYCCELSPYCHLYYQLRPIGQCRRRTWFYFASTWGDPHFTTFDGMRYTFNGLGEYVLTHIDTGNVTFDLHARTGEAFLDNGTTSQHATVFTAFAGADHTGAKFHAEMNRDRTAINLYGNGADLTNRYRNNDSFEYGKNGLIISRINDTISILFSSSGIALNISMGFKLMKVIAIIPTHFAGKTTGLLGNFDGDPDNDFITPDGIVKGSNMNESEIFVWGQLWEVNAGGSVLEYTPGKAHANYHDALKYPSFLEGITEDELEDASSICGGEVNSPCVYDYVITHSVALAMDTNGTENTAKEAKREIASVIPFLRGCKEVSVSKGETVFCSIAFDIGDDIVIDFIDNNVGAVVDYNSSAVRYVQTSTEPPSLSIVAVNTNTTKSSPPIHIPVFLCTGCSGHGKCSKTKAKSSGQENSFFKQAECECNLEYEGENCEYNFDGCAAEPCSHGRTCTDLSPEEHRQQNVAFMCGECPPGLMEDGIQCNDIDECADITDECEHYCANTEGGYICLCHEGYRPMPSDSSKCQDIDECSKGLHICTHKCENIPGGYMCSCYSGYNINDTTKECVPDEDAPPCGENGPDCTLASGCTKDDQGAAKCFCNIGFDLNDNKTECTDINECERYMDICTMTCNNFEGGFTCGCFPGYQLNEYNECKECVPPLWGEDCVNQCQCSVVGTRGCNHVYGCDCVDGWYGDTCEDDVDECSDDPGICHDARKKCVNVAGSYFCGCHRGYKENGENCVDVDECLDPTLNDCEQMCSNTEGGYVCGCSEGYTRNDSTTCQDIDECADGQNVCEHLCENYPGFYKCSCHYGYYIRDEDRTACSPEDFSPCDGYGGNHCTQICVVKNETATCLCSTGYRLESDGPKCTDIDECFNGNPCSSSAVCVNVPGNYRCTCPSGKKLENDGRTCTDCDEYHYGESCTGICSCLKGMCDPVKGCMCDDGWTGTKCDVDIDECITRTGQCSGANEVCQNTPGSYTCVCLEGFHRVNNNCKECNNNRYGKNCLHRCNCDPSKVTSLSQTCDTVTGSCRCKGQWTGTVCQNDYNECETDNICTGVNTGCHNLHGGYLCDCLIGYELDSNRKCLIESTPVVRVKGTTQTLTIILDINLPPGTNLYVRKTYESLLKDVENSLFYYFKRFVQGSFTITVIGMRKGTLIVDYVITLEDPDADTVSLIEAYIALALYGTLDYQNMTVTATVDGISTDRCAVYEYIIGKCAAGHECLVVHNKPYCSKLKDNVNFAVILGLGIGGGLFLLIIILLTVCLRMATIKKRRAGTHEPFTNASIVGSHSKRLPRTVITNDKVKKYKQSMHDGLSETGSQRNSEYNLSEGQRLAALYYSDRSLDVVERSNTPTWMRAFMEKDNRRGDKNAVKIPRAMLHDYEPKVMGSLSPPFGYKDGRTSSTWSENGIPFDREC